jgi:uncharacterized FlgJ-related protein
MHYKKIKVKPADKDEAAIAKIKKLTAYSNEKNNMI